MYAYDIHLNTEPKCLLLLLRFKVFKHFVTNQDISSSTNIQERVLIYKRNIKSYVGQRFIEYVAFIQQLISHYVLVKVRMGECVKPDSGS